MAAHSRVNGFTLIELLISITVLSMVIGIATFAFSLFSRNWEGKNGEFELVAGQLQRIDLLTGAIRDASAWFVTSGEAKESFGFYFLGRDEGMTFVTESPLFDPQGLAVIRIFREQEVSSLTWRLVYEEAPLRKVLLREASQNLPFQHRLVILQGLPSLEFRYYGWRSMTARAEGIETGLASPEWFAEYDGIVRQQQPMRLSMRIGKTEVFFDVAERDEVMIGRARGEG